ncbi:hypothetical protein RKD28_001669 [Streptomyces sp. SAI-229]
MSSSVPASTVQPITSSSPAADTAITPGTVLARPFSRTMAVSTGTAVIDRATPAKTTVPGERPGMSRARNCSWNRSAHPLPTAIGTRKAVSATPTAVRVLAPRIVRSSS